LRLVEYSKLSRHLAWTTHLMRECCNSVDIMPRSCGWAAAAGKWSDGREAVAMPALANQRPCSNFSPLHFFSLIAILLPFPPPPSFNFHFLSFHSPFPHYYPLPLLPFLSLPQSDPLSSLGERCKLPQRSPGPRPAVAFCCIACSENALVAAFLVLWSALQ